MSSKWALLAASLALTLSALADGATPHSNSQSGVLATHVNGGNLPRINPCDLPNPPRTCARPRPKH